MAEATIDPSPGDKFYLVKDMAGTLIYASVELGDNSARAERGRVGQEAAANVDIKTFNSVSKSAAASKAKNYVQKYVKRHIDNLYELKDALVTPDAVLAEPRPELLSRDKFVAAHAASGGAPIRRVYAGKDVVVTIKSGGELIALSGAERVTLPNRVRSGLHKYNGSKSVTLRCTLTWVNPNSGIDHESKAQADYHGGSKPNLVAYDVVSTATADARQTTLRETAVKCGWDRVSSSVYTPEVSTGSNAAEALSLADKHEWTGVSFIGNGGVLRTVMTNTAEYFVVVGSLRDNTRALVARFYKSGGMKAEGNIRVPKTLRSAVADLTVPLETYTDNNNATRNPAKAYAVKKGEAQWMHPKDYYTVRADRGVLIDIEVGRDVQLCETDDPE